MVGLFVGLRRLEESLKEVSCLTAARQRLVKVGSLNVRLAEQQSEP